MTLQNQKNQYRALRQAYNDTSYPPRFNTEELHRKAKLKPINQRLNQTANNIWNMIQRIRRPILQDLIRRVKDITISPCQKQD